MSNYWALRLTSRLCLIVLVILLNGVANNSLAQTTVFVNPGIKLGFTLGEKSELNFGYELSIVFFKNSDPQYNRYGIVFNYDNVEEIDRLHIGFEYIRRLVGIDIGPTFGWRNGRTLYGFSAIPFGGAILVPYYNLTVFFRKTAIHELGTYLKIPIGEYGGRLY